ncbi:unnamed protein product, partial [Rotaria magnacalcarata]
MAATNNDPISSTNKSLDTIEGFEDIFDIIDNDNDIFEYTIEELNKYFISGHLNLIPNEEEIIDVKGTLREAECHFIEVDRHFWPMQVQSLMLTQHKLTMNDTDTTSKTTTPMEIDTEDQQIACENLLNEHLQKIKRQIEYYGKELDEKQSTFIRFTSTIQETIEIHVQTYGIKP